MEIDHKLRFSPSRLSKYSSCHQRGHYEYGMQLAVVGKPTPNMKLGTITHRFLDLWHGMDIGPQEAFSNYIVREFPAYDEKLLSMTALTLMTRYVNSYRNDKDKFTILHSEHELLVPATTYKRRKITLHGKLDLIVQNEFRELGLWDHKTSSTASWTQDTVLFDTQLSQYLCMLMLMDYEPKFATINQIYTGITKPENVASAPQDKLFSRITIRPSLIRIEEWLARLLERIDFILDETHIHKNMGSHCAWCPFKQACNLELEGNSNVEYLKANFAPRGQEKFTVTVDLSEVM